MHDVFNLSFHIFLSLEIKKYVTNRGNRVIIRYRVTNMKKKCMLFSNTKFLFFFYFLSILLHQLQKKMRSICSTFIGLCFPHTIEFETRGTEEYCYFMLYEMYQGWVQNKTHYYFIKTIQLKRFLIILLDVIL